MDVLQNQNILEFTRCFLSPIFERHISEEANVTTDEWKGHRPISRTFKITRIPNESGLNFKVAHAMIHQVKSWRGLHFHGCLKVGFTPLG